MFIMKYPEIIINLDHVKEIHADADEGDNATIYVIAPDGTRTDFCTEDGDLIYPALGSMAASLSSDKPVWDWDSYVNG